jgi:hypothetical protein
MTAPSARLVSDLDSAFAGPIVTLLRDQRQACGHPYKLGAPPINVQARHAVSGHDLPILADAHADQPAARQTRSPSRFRSRSIIAAYGAKVGTVPKA